MTDSVLYFPSIRPPENEWFTRVLLYWDRVGTILPEELAEDHVFLRPHTSALLKEGLLVPVSPEPRFWYTEAGDHVSAFVNLVDRDPLQIGRAPTAQREWVRVHLTKIGYGLAMALVKRDLAKEPTHQRDDSLWIDVERRTADLLMAFLAAIVGKDEKVGMDPVTDSAAAIAAFTALPEHDRQIGTELVEPIRYALLRDILPGPAAGVEPARLAAFKADHEQLLTRFRRRVEREAIECAREPDRRFRAALVDTARSELKGELEEIERRMNERRWPLAARGALGVAVAALGIADLAVTGGSAFAFAGGSLGLAGSVDAAFQGRRRRDILEHPLAFAALARRELGRDTND